MFPANFKKDFDSDNAIMNVILALLAVWIGYTAVMQHHRAQERRRRKAEHEEKQRSFITRLSRPVREPLVERGITADQSKGRQHRSTTQTSSRRGTDEQSRDARRRQRQKEENERQLLLSIRRRETKGFTPLRDTPDDLQHQSPNTGPSSNVVNPRNQVGHSGDSQVAATQDNSTEAPALVNNGTQVAPKQASKKRARDDVNDHQDEEEDPSASRGFKRPCKGHEIVAALIALPGGYEHIQVDMLKPDRPEAQRRRKRDDLDSDYDDYDTEDPDALRRLSRARFIRRRVEKIKNQIENDPEILIVERFVQIAAKYAKFERFGELSTGHDDDDLLRSAHISEIEGEESETTDSETASTGSYHTGRDTTSDASADPATTSREKSKMSAQGSRKKSIHTSALITDAKAKIVAKVVAAADKRFNTVSLTPRRVPSSLAGESWTEANGTTWRISAKDGQRRQLVAVKNWRRKYHMPADSVHPDRFAMHRVLEERWVTSEEYAELAKEKLLGWQDDDHEPPRYPYQERWHSTVPVRASTPVRSQDPGPFIPISPATRPKFPIAINLRAKGGIWAPGPTRTPILRAYRQGRLSNSRPSG